MLPFVVLDRSARSDLITAPLPADDSMQHQPVIDQAREVLGWQSTVPLDAGLERTIPHLRALLREVPASAPSGEHADAR